MFAGSIIQPDAWSGELKQVGIRIPEIQTGTASLPRGFEVPTGHKIHGVSMKIIQQHDIADFHVDLLIYHESSVGRCGNP